MLKPDKITRIFSFSSMLRYAQALWTKSYTHSICYQISIHECIARELFELILMYYEQRKLPASTLLHLVHSCLQALLNTVFSCAHQQPSANTFLEMCNIKIFTCISQPKKERRRNETYYIIKHHDSRKPIYRHATENQS